MPDGHDVPIAHVDYRATFQPWNRAEIWCKISQIPQNRLLEDIGQYEFPGISNMHITVDFKNKIK